ncbi:MAG: hydantoinase B/oxoprolinase family protein [Saprospiraceae bacterium]|nr:hydantoinase B/oxoprolinase family protein [Saprospiraceae bacterium]
MKEWQIWIDTGGTFTDCIAQDPFGEILRIKTLSSSRLRGRLLEKVAPYRFRFTQQWRISEDIFQGYDFFRLGGKEAFAKIQSIDFQDNSLILNQDLALSDEIDFEITAHEEAPILATRIATKTPVQQVLPPLTMRLGSTKGTNALLEKKGAKVAFLVTKGFKDLLYIGTQQRPNLFQLNIPEPELLYSDVIEVEERMNADGTVRKPLSILEIERIISELQKKQPDAIAIALLHAYRNPIHEKMLEETFIRKGFRFVSLSSALTPSIKILPRAQTAVINAYLSPVMHDYLQNIQSKLSADSKLLVMTSAGGLVNADYFNPKDSLLSGPAGGVVGAARIGQVIDFEKVITFDMGGTSTDAARFDGSYDYRFVTKVGNAEMLSSSLAIETVAAGGGSVCYFDGHKLSVGPESAGASPGPACYGAGGPLTITDINLLLGKLDASAMGIPIHLELAQQALDELQKSIINTTGTHYSKEELLLGFEKIANEKMADAIRKISVAKGFDPKDYALLAFGGAGGLHACKIADLLGIDDIILPYDGGLLSAYGIGNARVERLAEQQILQLLNECKDNLPKILNSLIKKASFDLQHEGYIINDLEVIHQFAYLRFKGQDSTLEISYENESQLLSDFETQYRQLFGHYPAGRAIELESLKAIVGTKQQTLSMNEEQPAYYNPKPFKKQGEIPVFYWDELSPGAIIQGPAILLNPNSTAFIEDAWEAEVQFEKNIIARSRPTTKSRRTIFKQAIELELFTNRFTHIAEEMGAQLQRTAFSVNVKERLDFSCAILDANAELLVNAPHIPVHLGSLGICARLIKEKIKLGKADVVITNHPKYGGSHLPDVTLLSAVFSDQDELIGYVINRAHHAEIGGKRPGSMPPDAKNLVEEGVVIPPMYFVKNGDIQWESLEKLLQNAPYPTRSLPENLADINAALASLRTGEEALQKLVRDHGLEKVHHYMAALKQSAAEALQTILKDIENQTFSAEESLDDGYKICIKIAIQNGQIEIDFDGTSTVHPGNLNANISIVYSAVIYVLRLLCNKEIPLNEGLMKHVHIQLPISFLHPDFSDNDLQNPAVVGGNTEVSQRLVDTLLKALNLAACSQGTMNNFLFGNERFGYYETIGGGTGAGNGWHGRSAVHQHMTNTKITDPEELEFRYPVRLNRFEIRKDSGGNGKWRGGDGIIREVEFLEELDITILSQHQKEAPYGSSGGEAGRTGHQLLIKKDGTKRILTGIASEKVESGDRLIIETPGGGGFG